MTIQKQLDALVSAYNLLENPFYQAWSAGTLSTDKLRTYATEYNNFLALMPLGWLRLGDSKTAHEELEHAELWEKFADSLAAKLKPAAYPATQRLVALAQSQFADHATALGALYAFEVQQPGTATSKRQGLQTHYRRLHADEAYFEVHEHNEHESAKLLAAIRTLSPVDQQKALTACRDMSRALWDTLVAIHDHA